MQQFAVVVREIRKLLTSFKLVNQLLPYHLHILFGGLGVLFLEDLLYRTASFSSYNTLNTIFYDIPLHLIAHYGFFVGIWFTLISPNIKYLPYAFWGYAFVVLFPFEGLGLFELVRAAIYAGAGYALFRFSATSYSESNNRTLNG